jgi:hypothetical protein
MKEMGRRNKPRLNAKSQGQPNVDFTSFRRRQRNLFPARSPYVYRERCSLDLRRWSQVELTCAETREAAAEFALKILPQPQRDLVAAHLLGCAPCRREVEALTEIAACLLDLVPGTEPPLGFDHLVLARVAPRPRQARRVAIAVVAAAIVCALVAVAAVHIPGGGRRPATAAAMTAAFRAGGAQVGTFSAGGRPIWVSVAVWGLPVSGSVTCELVDRDGAVQTLGLFDLVDGTGSWAAPDTSGIGRDQTARLIDRGGRVLAIAIWP